MPIDPSSSLERTVAPHSVSFPVHDVEPETPSLPGISMVDSLKKCLRSGHEFVPEIVAVSDSAGRYLRPSSQNGLLAAVHLAFSCHLPLTLSPDIIWLAILQGFSRHVHVHAKELESRLMTHPGKHTIVVTLREAEWGWATVFEQFAVALEGHIGEWVRDLQADFSTTGRVERTASHVALMDLFSPYVQYILACVCGIPSICLKGDTADWIRMREKLALLRGYDVDDWLDEIDDILARFVDASRGNVDRAWWQQIYKLTPRYGGEDIEGWLGAFFPYLKDERQTFTCRRVKGETFTTDIVPPGVSDVRIKFVTPTENELIRIVSGFVGVEDLGRDGVTAKIGWAVVRNHFMEDFVENLDRYPWITKRPVPAARTELVSEEKDDSAFIFFESLPVDLELFYNATDGADLFGKGTLYSRETLENTARVSSGWRHLGAWADGSLLLFDDTVIRLWWTGFQWEYQVLATSFSDFMARLTAAQGSEYWEDENFVEPEITPIWREFRPPSPVQFYAAQALAKLQRQNARLRSMKLMRQDLFVIRPGLIGSRSRLPAALHSLYDVCDGFAQAGGFDIWPSERVTALPHTNSRWFEVGAAPGYRILFDAVADRGVAVIATAKGTLFQIARSFEDFLNAVDKAPQGLYWEWSASLSLPEFKEPPILWPDEKMDLRAASLDSPSE